MLHSRPQSATAYFKPGIQLIERAEALLPGIHPDTTTRVLHILLDDALLPAGGDIAKVRVEQVMRRHGEEACIDDATITFGDFIYGSLHVVVDAAPGNAAQSRKSSGVCIEQHLVTLCGIGGKPECATGA